MPHDFFLSYAHSDNKPAIPNRAESEWVTTFHNVLVNRVGYYLGRPVDSFFDRGDLSGNSALSPEIETGLGSSHLFVAISSPAYYRREWCRLERKRFLRELGDHPALAKRVFVIHTTDVDPLIKPLTWQGEFFPDLTGYYFFRENTSGDGRKRKLGDPTLTETETEYYKEVDRVAHDMAERIRQMETPGTPVAPTTVPLGDAVFLAENAFRSHNEREQLRAALQKAGFDVRPHTSLAGKSTEELAAAMADALAFVQIVSPALVEIPGGEGKTYDQVQLEAAAALPKFRWRAPDLDIDAAATNYPGYKDFAVAADVRATLLSSFQIDLLAALEKLRAERRVKQAVHGDEPLVLIAGDPADIDAHGAAITQRLQSHALGHLVTESPADELEAPDVRGFLVLYGGSKAEWVRDRLRVLRTLPITRTRDLPVGIYFCPPPPDLGRRQLLFDMPSFRKIRWDDTSSLDAFARAVGS